MIKKIVTSEEALEILQKGNERFSKDQTENPHRDHARRTYTSEEGQSPFATILGCSDSRKPVSAIFDRGVGDIFTIRLAGNVVGDMGTASIEYAVEHLGIPLLVILGHSSCGAVQAALGGGRHSVHINELLGKIMPAVRKTKADNPNLTGKELADEVARANVWCQAEDLYQNNGIVNTAVNDGKLVIMAAFYDLATGQVEWMGQYPSETQPQQWSNM